ncbi:hypothetical protein SK128_019138 [Halocaridina rubra]|uniref:DUF4789 domain-containing protein n=1 Tax=Halocaridina rubra TaxID=373956 RepID=A0AAN9ACC4_HALRR
MAIPPTGKKGPNAPPVDNCPRDEVRLPNGQCYQLLTQGPCMSREFILLNPVTLKGYCAPRLCSPDRIFVFSNQLCHDPRDQQICQGGKQLYQTSFGTPICQCPEGTYESDDDDLEDRGCEPMLSAASSCPPGQVFWFRNFRSPRECLDDPCGRENLQRSLQQHLLVPFAGDGNCYAVGQRGVCPQGTWYTLALSQLRGVCSTLEDSGYLVLDARQLADFETFYGPFIPKFQDEFSFVKPNVLPINSIPSNVASQRALHSRFLPFQAEPNTDGDIIGISVSYSPVLLGPVTADRVTEERIELQTPSKKLYAAPLVSHSSRKYQNIPETELIKGHLATEIRVSGRTDGVFSSQMSDIISVPIAQKFNSTASGIQFAKT